MNIRDFIELALERMTLFCCIVAGVLCMSFCIPLALADDPGEYAFLIKGAAWAVVAACALTIMLTFTSLFNRK